MPIQDPVLGALTDCEKDKVLRVGACRDAAGGRVRGPEAQPEPMCHASGGTKHLCRAPGPNRTKGTKDRTHVRARRSHVLPRSLSAIQPVARRRAVSSDSLRPRSPFALGAEPLGRILASDRAPRSAGRSAIGSSSRSVSTRAGHPRRTRRSHGWTPQRELSRARAGGASGWTGDDDVGTRALLPSPRCGELSATT
jgi:hypothetical protein